MLSACVLPGDGPAASSKAPSVSVPAAFTGTKGEYVTVKDTVRGFAEILDGKHDSVPEANFYMKGGIDMVKEA